MRFYNDKNFFGIKFIQKILKGAEFSKSESNLLNHVHVLDLHEKGYILPHVDAGNNNNHNHHNNHNNNNC